MGQELWIDLVATKKEYVTTTISFPIDEDPPPVVEPKGDWVLASAAPLLRGDYYVMFYTWVRQRSTYREPCPGKKGRACGSVAVKDGVCIGCGRKRND